MGYVRVKGSIGRSEVESTDVTFLVDTGAFYSAIPPKLADELNLKAFLETELTLADGRRVRAGITLAYIKLLDRGGVFPLAIISVPEPVIGVTVLEGLGLRVDPATGKLEHSRPYGLAMI